ncbi:MAG: HAD family hydrolase [Candidatus Omnitrophota bacterium]
MKKKFVIFDLDGTLINAYPAIISSFNFTMREFGYRPQKPDVIKKCVGWGDVNLLKPFFARRDLKKAVVVYRRHHMEALIKNARLMPYAHKVLTFLAKKGIKMAVATNRPTRFTHLVLKHLEIESFFTKILCTDRLKYAKPNPLVLNMLVKHAKFLKSETVYVGDMALDVQTARRAGIDSLVVVTGSSTLAELKRERPAYVIKGLREIFKIFHQDLF